MDPNVCMPTLQDGVIDILNKSLYRDTFYKDVSSLLNCEANGNLFFNNYSGKVTFSGNRELDYPTLAEKVNCELEIVKSYPLPDDLVEKFASMQSSCLMGIFPACNRAWVTIDNELFMWNYEDGEDLAYFDGISDIITAVALIQPTTGSVPDYIKFFLCTATPTEVWLLGMISKESSNSTAQSCVWHLIPEPLYCVSTDNCYVTCIEGTYDGRMFLGTREGYLLEMVYQPIANRHTNQDDDLLTVPLTGTSNLINHSTSTLAMFLPSMISSRLYSGDAIVELVPDCVRNLVYVRTESSCLSVYQYESKSVNSTHSSLTRVGYLSGSDLSYAASNVVRSIDRGQFRHIVSIVPLSSGNCHLMAVTKTGIRLYFAKNLQLLHIRLPPSSPYNTIGLSEVKLVTESRGTVIMISNLPKSLTDAHSATKLPLKPRNYSDGISNFAVHNTSLQNFSMINDGGDGLGCYHHNNSSSANLPSTNAAVSSLSSIMYVISPDLYPWASTLTESFSTSWCTDGVWTFMALQDEPCISMKSTGTEKSSNPLPVVLTQHLDKPYRRFLLISAQGVVHFRLTNPLNRLRNYLIEESNSTLKYNHLENEFPIQYLNLFNPDESICSALIIAANAQSTDESLRLIAEQTILYFAAESTQHWTPTLLRSFRPNMSVYSNFKRPFGGNQDLFSSENQYIPGASSSSNENDEFLTMIFLLDGIFLFLARILNSIWAYPLFEDVTNMHLLSNASRNGQKGLKDWMKDFLKSFAFSRSSDSQADMEQIVVTRLESHEIGWFINQLTYLQSFLKRYLFINRHSGLMMNQYYYSSAAAATTTVMTSKSAGNCSSSSDLQQLELKTYEMLIDNLDRFLTILIQVLGFWKILSEHVFYKIFKRLSNEHRILTLNQPMEVYITSLLSLSMSNGGNSPADVCSSGINNKPLMNITNNSDASSYSTTMNKQLGMDVIEALINALIESYLLDSKLNMELDYLDGENHEMILVNQITSRLNSTCPLLFANEDALCAKAGELLTHISLLRSHYTSMWKSDNDSSVVGRRSILLGEIDCVNSDNDLAQIESKINSLLSEAIGLYIKAGPGIRLDSAVQRLENCGAWRGAVRLCLHVAIARDPSNITVDCLKNGRLPTSDPFRMHLGGFKPKIGHTYNNSEVEVTQSRYEAYHRLISCLDHLLHFSQLRSDATQILPKSAGREQQQQQQNCSVYGGGAGLMSDDDGCGCLVDLDKHPQQAKQILQTVLHDIVQTDDILAHFEIFSWLLTHGLTDTILLLESSNLEAYLRSRFRQTPHDPVLRCLLWRYLERTGSRLEAAQVLEHLAVTPSNQLTLEDRLDFAARAIVVLKAMPSAEQDLDYLRDLEACLKLAQLQQQLYNELLRQLKSLKDQQYSLNIQSSPCKTPSPIPSHHYQRSPKTATQLKHGSPNQNLNSSMMIPNEMSIQKLEKALDQLTHGPLISLTEMFTNYADPFNLHESKLHLLWVSGSQDSALIQAIWCDLLVQYLCPPFAASSTLSPGDKRKRPASPNQSSIINATAATTTGPITHSMQTNLVDCLSRLSNRFLLSCTDNNSRTTMAQNSNHNHNNLSNSLSIYLPFGEIVSTLEHHAIRHGLEPSWVPTLLREAQLLCFLSPIVEAYVNMLVHSKVLFWRRAEVNERLFQSLLILLNDFIKLVRTNSSSLFLTGVMSGGVGGVAGGAHWNTRRHRQAQINGVRNQIENLLFQLHSDLETDTRKWIEPLKHVQNSLQQCA